MHIYPHICNAYFRRKGALVKMTKNIHSMHVMYKTFLIKFLIIFNETSCSQSHLNTVLERYLGLPNSFCPNPWLRQFSVKGSLFHPFCVTNSNTDKYHRCNLACLCAITWSSVQCENGIVYSCYKEYFFFLKYIVSLFQIKHLLRH